MMKNDNKGLRTVLAVAIAATALTGCGNDKSPAAVSAAGNMTVQLQGGTGGNGAGNTGGSGDYFELNKEAGAGDVKVLATGSVNASFTSLSFTPGFGAVPAVVSANTDLSTSLLADCSALPPATGTLYQVTGQQKLFKSNGITAACEAAEVVTGLDVASGVTLKLANNWNAATQSFTTLDADIRNNGTITIADASATQRGSIDLRPNSYIGSGKIDTSGTIAAPNAGNIYVRGDYAVINSGKITASGADSTTAAGGNAGYINLRSDYYTQSTGDLTARGGNTTAAFAGGNGNELELYSDWGPTYNSGDLDGRGGEGATGGSAGEVNLYAGLGKLFNSGNVMVYGANSTTGNGGNGGYIGFEAYGGEIRNSGNMQGWGGNTTDATGSGGNGNQLYAYTDYGSLYEYSPAGDIHWSGQIDLHGGNAVATGTGNGGSAGSVYANISADWINLKSDLVFLGYSNVKTFGGDGNNGGSAGGYYLYNYDGYVYGNQDAPAPGGNVTSEAKVLAHGGNAVASGIDTNGWGGSGGDMYLETDYYATAQLVPDSQKVKHTGDVNLSGGTGRNQTIPWNNGAGSSWIWGYNGSSVTGNIIAEGGDDLGVTTGTVGYGGYTPSFEVYSELGAAAVNGNITVNGGDGNYQGYSGGDVYIYGNTVKVSGTIKANGGNARVAEPGSQGGNGGYIELKAIRPEASSVSGTATYAGGTGATAGTEGGIMRLISCTGAGC